MHTVVAEIGVYWDKEIYKWNEANGNRENKERQEIEREKVMREKH